MVSPSRSVFSAFFCHFLPLAIHLSTNWVPGLASSCLDWMGSWDGFEIFLDPKVPKLYDPQGLMFSELDSNQFGGRSMFFFLLTAPQSPLFLVVIILKSLVLGQSRVCDRNRIPKCPVLSGVLVNDVSLSPAEGSSMLQPRKLRLWQVTLKCFPRPYLTIPLKAWQMLNQYLEIPHGHHPHLTWPWGLA